MSKTAYRGFNPATVVGGLRDDFNQEWYPSRNMSSNRTSARPGTLRNSAKLDGLLFMDWDVINPPPPSSSPPSASISESTNARNEREEKKRVAEEQKRIALEKQKEMEAKKAEYENKFNKHSSGGKGVNAAGASAFAIEEGFVFTAAEMLELEKKCGGSITLEKLLAKFAESSAKVIPHDDLADMFKIFDSQGTGKFTKSQLKNILTVYGEPLTKEEFDCLMEECGYSGTDKIDYREFCSKLCEE